MAWLVVHPLDDTPEQKVDMTLLGRMRLTRGTRLALLSLRCYLVLIIVLVCWRVWTLAH
jgi:hypothetical protein